jgi:hypothetical protein
VSKDHHFPLPSGPKPAAIMARALVCPVAWDLDVIGEVEARSKRSQPTRASLDAGSRPWVVSLFLALGRNGVVRRNGALGPKLSVRGG